MTAAAKTQDLHRLVYYSRNRLNGTPEQTAAEIRTILATSQANNARVGVTGALMFNAGCFAQVLEGPQAAVETTFERIQQDDRHGEVFLLAFERSEVRAFDSWSMGFVGASVDDAARYGQIAGDSGYDPARMTGEELFLTLQNLALEEERITA
jgi:hypothetical protein